MEQGSRWNMCVWVEVIRREREKKNGRVRDVKTSELLRERDVDRIN